MGGITARLFASIWAIRAIVKLSSPSPACRRSEAMGDRPRPEDQVIPEPTKGRR
jgi:hypothetical protein